MEESQMTMGPDSEDPTTSSEIVLSPPPAASAPPIVPELQEIPEVGYAITAQPIAPNGGRRAGKTRSPWGVYLLSIVTFGIYFLYWYYKVNAEVREYDHSIDVQPGISVLSQFVPIASWVSLVRTAGRISRAQRVSGTAHRCSGLIGIVLVFLLGTWVVYYQSQLNKVWDMYGNPPEHSQI
jgi:hypothetical protein